MPTVARFYGITVKMFFTDHFPPHFHAVYGKRNAMIDIKTLEMMEGDLPRRALNLVKEWGTQHHAELQQMWDSKEFVKLPGLE